MNKLEQLFKDKKSEILSVYFTAGYPSLNDTAQIILTLEKAGADLIEVGMPYSDPLADGPTIQESGQIALKNGMNLPLLFEQLMTVKEKANIPLIMMGHFNQVMQYGEEAFLKQCKAVGVAGLILPDLPVDVYKREYKDLFEKYELPLVFLISPSTSEARIRKIDELSRGFIYMVSSSSTTGAKKSISENQVEYFNRIKTMQLQNPRMVGFGISNHQTFSTVCKYSSGAIIGSAFIKALSKEGNLENKISDFVKMILNSNLNPSTPQT